MELILKYTLNKIIEQTSSISTINYGGCCQFAKLLSKELESRNIGYKVVFFNFGSSDTYVKAIKNRDMDLRSIYHVCIKIGKTYIDGENIATKASKLSNCNIYKPYNLLYKDLLFYSNHATWNPQFNRRKYHPIISKIIKEQFKIYDKLINGK